MDSTINLSNFSQMYTGNVKITCKYGGKVYSTYTQHNEGTTQFFDYILRSISGNNTINDRPTLVWLFEGEPNAYNLVVNFGILYESVSAVTINSTTGAAEVTFNFVIPDTIASNKTITKLELTPTINAYAADKVYAILELANSITILPNSNVEVNWTLAISNKTGEV